MIIYLKLVKQRKLQENKLMHNPMKIKDLIEYLQSIKNKDKEVLVNIGFNKYDISNFSEGTDSVLFYLLQKIHRDSEPEDIIG
jgi:hypothetical protein